MNNIKFQELSTSNKIITIVFILVCYFGLDFHFKTDIAKKKELLKQELLKICSIDENCQSDVKIYFQRCFDDNFDENSVGHYQRFAHNEFSECMNNNADANYFKPIRLDKL